MRVYFTLFLIIISSINFFAQELNYNIEENISYYPTNESGLTAYQKAQCRLDIYWPTQKKEVPVIIWFHGGGLTG